MIVQFVQFPGGKREIPLDGPGPKTLEQVLAAAGIEYNASEKADYAVNGEPTKDPTTQVPDGAVVTRTTSRVEGG